MRLLHVFAYYRIFRTKDTFYIHQVSAGFCLFQQRGKITLQRISLDGGEVTCNHSAFPLHSIARNRLLQKHHSDQENQRKIQLLWKKILNTHFFLMVKQYCSITLNTFKRGKCKGTLWNLSTPVALWRKIFVKGIPDLW